MLRLTTRLLFHPSVISVENLVAKHLGYAKKVNLHQCHVELNRIEECIKSFSCNESGLILHSENVILGVSVDGVVTCAFLRQWKFRNKVSLF